MVTQKTLRGASEQASEPKRTHPRCYCNTSKVTLCAFCVQAGVPSREELRKLTTPMPDTKAEKWKRRLARYQGNGNHKEAADMAVPAPKPGTRNKKVKTKKAPKEKKAKAPKPKKEKEFKNKWDHARFHCTIAYRAFLGLSKQFNQEAVARAKQALTDALKVAEG